MTVNNATSKIQYNGNSSTTVFSFPYPFIAASDLVVQSVAANGTITTKVLTTDYTISGTAPYPAGANVTMLVAPATGTKLVISRVRPFTQDLDLIENDPLPAELVEQDFDHVVMLCQQLSELVNRSLVLSISSLFSGLTIADPIANNLVGWNAAGTGLENKGVSSASLNVTTFFAAGNAQPSVAPTATGTDALSIGSNAVTNGTRSLAIGKAYAAGTDALAINNGDNSTTYGAKASNATVLGGIQNVVTQSNGTAVGGVTNTVGGTGGSNTAIGGQGNVVSGAAFRAAVIGGDSNTVSGGRAVCMGGNGNQATAINNAIVGGQNCTTNANYATVVGGTSNVASAINAAVVGGDSNEAQQSYSGIVGGRSNIASGTNCGVVGGESHTAGGTDVGIVGGRGSTITSTRGAAVGGDGNTLDAGQNNATVGGNSHVVEGSDAVAIGGNASFITGDRAVAIGGDVHSLAGIGSTGANSQANTTMRGQQTVGFGSFVTPGDAQSSKLGLRGTTTNATLTEIFLNGVASERLVIPNDTSWVFDILVVARRTDADNESAMYRITGGIDRNANAASTAIVGTPTVTVIAEDNAAWDVAVSADTTNGALALKVTGQAAKNIRWVASPVLVEVTG